MDIYLYIGLFLVVLFIFCVAGFKIAQYKRKNNNIDLQKQMTFGSTDNGNKNSRVEYMESMLCYSGLMSIKWMNAELFLLLEAISSILIALLFIIITKNFFIAIAMLLLTVFVFYGLIHFLVSYRDKSVEKELLLMMDMIGAYSASVSDLIDIVERVSSMLHGVLKNELRTAVSQAKSSGQKEDMFDYLVKVIRYDNFQFLIENLRTISDYNTNYGQIIDIIKDTIDRKIKSNQKIASIYAKGRIELILYLLIGIYAIAVTQNVCGVNAISTLSNSVAGMVIMVIYELVNIYVLYVALIKNSVR